jgi:hypothetical protein
VGQGEQAKSARHRPPDEARMLKSERAERPAHRYGANAACDFRPLL